MMNYSGYPAPTYPNYGTVGQQQFYPQKQEVVRVNGQNGANAYQMAPNSSILLLDETAPIIGLKTTDGASYPTVTGYVDATTKRNAVKTGIEKGIEGEQDTKKLYEKMYKELFALGEIADAEYLACLIKDVNEELAQVQSLYIKKKSCDFDISSIMGDQEEKADKYGCKIKEIGK